jgi:hypothetical protein
LTGDPRHRAWADIHDLLPEGWAVGPSSYEPGRRKWTGVFAPGLRDSARQRADDQRAAPTDANICSMRNRPSLHPRDQATRAALNDAAVIAAMTEPEIRASYYGTERAEYTRVLAEWLSALDGTIEDGGDRLVVRLRGREIAVRF